MDRREFLTSAATLGAMTMASTTVAAQAQAPAPGRGGAAAPAAPVMTTPLVWTDINSFHLQWVRTPADVAKAVKEMAYDGVSLTVGGAGAHVSAENAATELPAFVNALKTAGVPVRTINTQIVDADANAERVIAAAAAAGVRTYTWGGFTYDLTKPIQPQLDALKARVDRLSRLNQRHGVKAMYTTSAVPGAVGSRVWDILSVLKQFDSRNVSLQFDMADMIALGGNEAWVVDFLAAGPYIGGIVAADVMPYLNVQTPQGGPFTGNPADLQGGRGGGGGGGAAAAGRGGAPAAAPPPPPGAKPPEKYATTLDGRPVPTDRGGGGTKVLPWYFTNVPLGTGMLDLPKLAAVVKQTGFVGPIEIQAKYPNGGAESGATKITEDAIMVRARMKRDLLAFRVAFSAAGLVPTLYSLQGR